jgi:hypothetical protein
MDSHPANRGDGMVYEADEVDGATILAGAN